MTVLTADMTTRIPAMPGVGSDGERAAEHGAQTYALLLSYPPHDGSCGLARAFFHLFLLRRLKGVCNAFLHQDTCP